MPRLSKRQHTEIVDKLIKNRKYALSVTFVGEAGYASSYVSDLAEALREGGWEVSGPSHADYLLSMPGVMVGVDELSTPNACARLLVDVLTAVGIKTRVVRATTAEPAHCCLIIAGSGEARNPPSPEQG